MPRPVQSKEGGNQEDRFANRRRPRFLKKRWHKIVFFTFVFLVVSMLVDAGISRLYRYWDVGSNSWFDRFKGDGWDFQRGAATVDHDQFGDTFSKVKYLDQGWKPSESMWYYTTTQGSDLMPYDFFMALEKPGTSELVRSNENLNSFRYLIQKPTRSDPDGLPVGLVKDSYKGKEYFGFTCAACHTGEVIYNGTAIRLDGGAGMPDLESFIEQLASALRVTQDNDDVRRRFVKRVMDRGNYNSEDAVLQDLKKYSFEVPAYAFINDGRRHTARYGYARLDAFGRSFNRIFEHILNPDQLRAVLQGLVRDKKITQADLDAIMQGAAGKVLTGAQRDNIVERVAQLLPLKVQVELRNKLFIAPDAPVSYPYLWDIPQHDYVQWNGLAPNAGLGPIGRNAGEVTAVFATLDWQEKRGFSLAALITGQGFKSTHIDYTSSVKVGNLRLFEDQLKSLHSPLWPDDVLPPIDPARKARGETLFASYCASCHTQINRLDPQRRIVVHFSRLADIGTDPKMAMNAVTATGLSGFLRNEYVNTNAGPALINEQAPAAALFTKTTFAVVATPEPGKNPVRRFFDWVSNLISANSSNEIKPSIKQGDYDPDTTADPYASLRSYKARALNGIWATAPYLHNGSVPTLYDLLLPKKCPGDPDGGEYRPDTFQVGSRQLDPDKVGLKSSGYEGFKFNTSYIGNSNAGHDYGTGGRPGCKGEPQPGLTREQRLDLVEYLKSL